jgi:hypothetical protein
MAAKGCCRDLRNRSVCYQDRLTFIDFLGEKPALALQEAPELKTSQVAENSY